MFVLIIFPSSLDAFNDYITVAIPYMNTNKTRLTINTANITALLALQASWNTQWALYQNKNTLNKSVRDQIHNLHGQIVTLMTTIFHDIPNSVLTVDDRNTLHLAVRDNVLTHAGVMGHAPMMSVADITHLQQTIRFVDPDSPHSQQMPAHQKIVHEMFVGAAGLPPDQIHFANATNVTHFLQEFPFVDGDVGKTAYHRSGYENTRSQRGPWSDTLAVVVA